MNDREILNHLLKSAREDVEYFSNQNKDTRERWIVSAFLTILGIEHQEQDLISLEQRGKTDVRFRDAFFQVKELPDPELRRNKMYKDAYNSIKAAKKLEEVVLVSEVRNVPPVANMYALVLSKSKELAASESYEQFKGELDLVIYVTRTRASLIQQDEISTSDFATLGWRSISCVNSKQAVVLFAAPSAPEFIQKKSQQLVSASTCKRQQLDR